MTAAARGLHPLEQLGKGPRVRKRHRRKRIERGKQRVGLGLGKVKDENRHDLLGVQAPAKVPVDEHENPVLLSCDQGIGVADLPQQAPKRRALALGVTPPVPGVGGEVAGADPAKLDHSVTDHRAGPWSRSTLLDGCRLTRS